MLVEHRVDDQVGGRSHPLDVLGQGRAEPGGRVDPYPQVEDRQPQLAGHPLHVPTQLAHLARCLGRDPFGDVVEQVADAGQLLRDTVVDLPGEPVPLVHGGQLADLVEEKGGRQTWARVSDQLLDQLQPVAT